MTIYSTEPEYHYHLMHSLPLSRPHLQNPFRAAPLSLSPPLSFSHLQYPFTIFPATTLDSRSHALSDPSTGAPSSTTSSTTPSLPVKLSQDFISNPSLSLITHQKARASFAAHIVRKQRECETVSKVKVKKDREREEGMIRERD